MIILTSFCLIFLVGKDFLNTKKSDTIYSNIKKVSPLVESNDTNSNSFEKLKETNSDYQFWIQIPNTNIDYPVVKGSDNEFYLEHDFNKNPLKDGSVFLDYRNNLNTDFNNIIFGHNMKNGNIFSDLNKFKKEEFFNENKIIKIADKNFTYEYEIFSLYVDDATNNFDYLYNINNLKSEEEKLTSVNKLKEKSIFKTNSIIELPANILTLITCSYEFNDARTILHAKQISKTKNI